MVRQINFKKLVKNLAIPLGVGLVSGLLTRGGVEEFNATAIKPFFMPPGWVFPIVWSILYLLMGYASYRALYSGGSIPQIRRALFVYGIQLFLNFLWPILFFGFEWYLAAFILLLFLWAAILVTMHQFSRLDEVAGNLLIPYLLWVTFAGYLNLGVVLLN